MKTLIKKQTLVVLLFIVFIIILFTSIKYSSILAEVGNENGVSNEETKSDEQSSAEFEDLIWTQEQLDKYFGDCETNLILDIPNGGYISCPPENSWDPFTIEDAEGNVIANYVLATDPNTMTVQDMKKHLLGKPIENN